VPVHYITYQQIDKLKWDRCIDTAPNGLVYGYSFYLDAMAKHWDALVLNDYEAVMPLTWNKKYRTSYLYQPFFCAALGVFGNNLSTALVNDFLHTIPATFTYWDIYLNPANRFKLSGFNLCERVNFVLPLNEPYERLYNNFRNNLKRNIKKSAQLNCTIKTAINIDAVITLAKEQSKKISPVTDADYTNFKKVYQYLHAEQKAVTYGVYMPNNELVASCAFIFSHNRAYYILVGNHPNGKTAGASHAIINAFIKDNAGQHLLLDFEGSDIPSLAFFYSSFGAAEEKFTGLKLNRLPFWMKWFKR
jgi:hypothetical protein